MNAEPRDSLEQAANSRRASRNSDSSSARRRGRIQNTHTHTTQRSVRTEMDERAFCFAAERGAISKQRDSQRDSMTHGGSPARQERSPRWESRPGWAVVARLSSPMLATTSLLAPISRRALDFPRAQYTTLQRYLRAPRRTFASEAAVAAAKKAGQSPSLPSLARPSSPLFQHLQKRRSLLTLPLVRRLAHPCSFRTS